VSSNGNSISLSAAFGCDLVWKDNKPKSAKSVGKGALISVIVGVIFYVLLMILFGVVFCIMSSNM